MNPKIIFTTALLYFLTLSAIAQSYKVENNIPYRTQTATDVYMKERCVLDVFYPTDKKGFKTIVWFHGGGMIEGEKHFPEKLKNKGIALVAVNYRLSPRANNPAYTDDVAAAVAWVFNNIERFGGDPSSIFVAGHSAGGYLTLMLGLDKHWLAQYGVDANKIAGLFPISGQTITHNSIRKERGLPVNVPLVDNFAPLNQVRDSLPPLLLITGDRKLEITSRYEENALLYSILEKTKYNYLKLYELNGFNHNTVLDPACYLILETMEQLGKME